MHNYNNKRGKIMTATELENIIRSSNDLDRIQEALVKLSELQYSRFLEIALEYLEQDAIDEYFQALLIDCIAPADLACALSCLLHREKPIEAYLLGDIMKNMLYLLPQDNLRKYIPSINERYQKLTDDEKEIIREYYEEFKNQYSL